MTTILLQTAARKGVVQGLRHGRAVVVVAIALVSLLAATVAIGQVSENFDLACRGMLAAGGNDSRSSNFAVIGAMALPIIPPVDSNTAPTYGVRSAKFGVRAGFLPAYPNGVSAAAAALQPVSSNQEIEQRLPLLYKVGRIIRLGC